MNYLNKILIVLLSLTLFGCSSDTNDNDMPIEDSIEYIEPMQDIFIYGQINETLRSRIDKAKGEGEYQNYQFKMLFKDIYKEDIEDIYGNVINLSNYKYLVFEVSSVTCNHCKELAEKYMEAIIEDNPDIMFVQYFDDGEYDEIKQFYEEIHKDIPSNLTIIPKSEELHEYIYDEVGMEFFPTLAFYLDGKLNYSTVGIINRTIFNNAKDLGFINPIQKEELYDEDGNYLIEMDRSIEDVRNSLSNENVEKIESLSSDLYTAELTYKLIGKHCDFDDRLSGSSLYISEIDNYDEYKDKNVVLLYLLLEDTNDTDKIDFVNELIASNDTVSYIVVFVESYSSSSNIYKQMNHKIVGAPIVSILGTMPVDFYNYGMVAFPSAVYINKSTFVGAYSKISDVDSFNYSIDLFLSDNSIAYKKNN